MGSSGEVTLVIVGAGASFGCLGPNWGDAAQIAPRDGAIGPVRDLRDVRLPLTKDLVSTLPLRNEIVTRYSQCLPLVGHLRAALASRDNAVSLEAALEEYGPSDPMSARHLMAFRFYLRDLVETCTDYMYSANLSGGETHYTHLIGATYKWAGRGLDRHVCYVSFNYDPMLEYACKDHWGLDPENLSSYVDHARASVVKPHGSALWHWPLTGPYLGNRVEAARWVIENAADARYAQAVGFAPREARHMSWQVNDANVSGVVFKVGIPALALPTTNKDELLWPLEQDGHFSRLDGRITRVIIIGWRAAEQIFVDRLRMTVAPNCKWLTAVAPVEDGPTPQVEVAEIFDRLRLTADEKRTATQIYSGFAGLTPSTYDEFLGA